MNKEDKQEETETYYVENIKIAKAQHSDYFVKVYSGLSGQHPVLDIV